MSEQKYRAYHKKYGMIYQSEYFTLEDAINGDLTFFGSPAKDYDTRDFIFMQYTGLKDKNRCEIYEGDIVRRGYFALNDFGKFGPEEPWNHLPEGIGEGDITTILEVWGVASDIAGLQNISEAVRANPDVVGVEVIGNMYENPDLVIGPGFVR